MSVASELARDIGLLLLRVGVGATMALSHGRGKLERPDELERSFPDPLGVGHAMSAHLAIGAEVGASALIAFGLGTRLSAIPAAFTMGVAFFVIHGDDPFAKRELSLLYLLAFTAILLMGPGRFSIDRVIGERFAAWRSKGARR